MKVEFLSKFDQDLDEISQPSAKKSIASIIQRVESVSAIHQIPHLKKLQGFKNAFRIRVGDFRIGIFVEGGTIQFARVKNRKDIYRFFP